MIKKEDVRGTIWDYEYSASNMLDYIYANKTDDVTYDYFVHYTYDDAGNLIQTVDNKGQVIVYTYDGANRMLTEDYQDASPITPDIRYHYDAPSSDYPYAANTRGKMTWIEDLSGALFFSYDSRGNAEWSVKRIYTHIRRQEADADDCASTHCQHGLLPATG